VLREQPFCADGRVCGGLEPSVEVDHIVPLAFGGHPTDRSNLQGICRTCHEAKTRTDDAV
jgi:5-methylcytosine-specific restriction protein A